MTSPISKEDQNDDLIDQVLQMTFLNQHIYSKIQFDNAKDTSELLEIANQNAQMMMTAAKSRLISYVDGLLERRLRKIIDESDGKISIVVGNGEFVAFRVEERNKEK